MNNSKILGGVLVLSGVFFVVQSVGAINIVPTRVTMPPTTQLNQPAVVATTSNVSVGQTVAPTNLNQGVVSVNQVDQLDPQPEPPMLKAVDKLDPQPEPPMIQNMEQENLRIMMGPTSSATSGAKESGREDAKEMKPQPILFGVVTSTLVTTGTVEIIPNENSLWARFEHNRNKINIPVRVNFTVEGGNSVLNDGSANYNLKMPIPEFYANLNLAMEKIGLTSSSLKNIELTVQNSKPVYNTTIEQRGKLFGFIPLKIKNNVQISENGDDVKIENHWYTKFFTNLSDLTKIKFVPNITISKLEIIPANFKEGETVKIKATLQNTGNSQALSMPSLSTGGGSSLTFYANNQYVGGYSAVPIVLAADESAVYYYTWDSAVCGAPVRAEFESKMTETSQTDNILAIIANCAN